MSRGRYVDMQEPRAAPSEESVEKARPGRSPEESAARMGRAAWISCVVLIGIYTGLALFSIHRGQMDLDEGWYALAGWNVINGKRPYLDFLFTQMPLSAYFYALAIVLVGKSLLALRYVSLLLGLGSLVLVGVTCKRRGGPWAAVIGVALLALNLDFALESVYVRTPTLTVFLTALSMFFYLPAARWSMAAAFLTMSLAVLTRLSFGPALLVLWIAALAEREHRRSLLPFVLANVILLGAVVAWFKGPNMLFGVLGFHSEYYGFPRWTPGFFYYFVKGVLTNQLPIIVCAMTAVVVLIVERRRDRARPIDDRGRFLLWVLAAYVATTLLHASRPICYPTFQNNNVAFAVVFAGAMLGPHLASLASPARSTLVAMLSGLLVLSTPIQRFDVHISGDGALPRLREAAAYLDEIAEEGDRLLTFNAELAIETRIPLLPSYEMGLFSYFPRMEEDRARALHAVSSRRMRQELESSSKLIVCLTARDRSIIVRGDSDWLSGVLGSRYRHVRTFHGYGPFLDDLDIYKPR